MELEEVKDPDDRVTPEPSEGNTETTEWTGDVYQVVMLDETDSPTRPKKQRPIFKMKNKSKEADERFEMSA